MENYSNVIDRLKIMECPAGKVEDKILNILLDYNVANRNDIEIKRVKEDIDNSKNGQEFYLARINGNKPINLELTCISGEDDYVAKVVEVNIN